MWWWPWSSRRGRSVQVKLIKMGGRLVRHSRRLTGLAGPDYDATVSFGLPFEPEDSQYGKYRTKTSGKTPRS